MSVRTTVLDALRDAASPVTVADLSAQLDTPPTTVRFHLKSLTDDGLVQAAPGAGTGRGRPQMQYRLRPAMDPAGPRDYGFLADALVDALDGTPDGPQRAMAAGHELGLARASTDRGAAQDVMTVLADMGFAPSVARGKRSGDGTAIRLGRCPFLEAARRRPGITCSVHQGLMQGVLDAHRDGGTVARLDAFVDGDHCLAQLSDRSR
ncbi:helix-turn-helix domain-containing protein [Gordonia sp. HY002]|uniref:helix-turn-helix transcriptional regulator n=1 Tax=Gordonia zhenghanii TaxID=2911516 RepID=UPI001EF03BED|nr:helix-turn-helix domain-containing protein [Gordonia zhenghanii]MCF8568945.1 helix-turn-helix domain-containing protein [Gordonia zhenghanii]MCF8603040.1 helix-turn-helix domain-containing protein [Gordonia zhenghanii]